MWLGLGATAAMAVGTLWAERRPIATQLIDRKLAEWRVPARYRIDRLDLGRQRLVDVVLGDPAHPDLTADWIDLDTHIGLDGARIVGIRAGRVRVRGELVNGTLHLGSVDRLLPAASGKAFRMPAIDLDLADGALDLATPWGRARVTLSGAGRLDGGFRGALGIAAPDLVLGGCRADDVRAAGSVVLDRAGPQVAGPLHASSLVCGGTVARDVRIDQSTTLAASFGQWRGKARLAVGAVNRPDSRFGAMSGSIDYDGTAARTSGRLALRGSAVEVPNAGVARDMALAGTYQVGRQGISAALSGTATMTAASPWRRAVARLGGEAAGTPLSPVATRLGSALDQAMANTTLSATLRLDGQVSAPALTINALAARSATGAAASFSGAQGLTIDPATGRWAGQGTMRIAGGGLPNIVLDITPGAGGVRAQGAMMPYVAGNAAIALDRIDALVQSNRAARIEAVARLSGPLPGGRVDGVRLPVSIEQRGGRIAINAHCAPLSADRVRLSGVSFVKPALALCPQGGAMATLASGRLGGGIAIGPTSLTGSAGTNPLALRFRSAKIGLAAAPRFEIAGLDTGVGAGDEATHLAATSLDGRLANGAMAGSFAGGHGRIGAVPLDLSNAAGTWRWHGGTLVAHGKLTVADTDSAPRFFPVTADGVTLTLADNRITTSGTLFHPKSAAMLSKVTITHDLTTAEGQATLAVSGVTFDKNFQPDDLTGLTRGVIADVAATIVGEGHIAWVNGAVTSDGVFSTHDADLAALFGPVTGLTTQIHFTDLLNLESAPDQVATVVGINTGVIVENGVIHYRLLPGERIDVSEAKWPFAGGDLRLQPTLLDFTEHHERNLTFRMTGVDAAQFLLQFDFSNLNATGIFDGTLPIIFDERGGRVEHGRLVARSSGGNIAYVGEVSQKDLGFYGNFAFQSLKSLDYRNLTIDLNGPLDGEVITDIRFSGLSQGKGAKRNWLVSRLAHLPLQFNVRVTAPFRQLLDSAMGFYDPGRYVRQIRDVGTTAGDSAQSLPPAAPPVQPADSHKGP